MSTNKNSRALFGFIVLVLLTIGVMSLISLAPRAAGQSSSKGWMVWVRNSPCSGRADWISVAQRNPAEGSKGSFQLATLIQSPLRCTVAAPDGCTFDEAMAEANVVRASDRFSNFCCRDYFLWQKTATKEVTAVKGDGSAGLGWTRISQGMCCEEAEKLSGKTGLCGGTKAGAYVGCYKDTSAFDVDGFQERSDKNTPERCIATCRAKGFKYAAVQNGQSCLCGNTYGKYGPATNCDSKCTGDPTKICGGSNANSIYLATEAKK